VHELAQRAKKKLQETDSWRDGTTKIFDSDADLRTVRDSYRRKEIPDSLKDITPEDAKQRGLSEQERVSRNLDFARIRKRGGYT
jgi:hypothetical protein